LIERLWPSVKRFLAFVLDLEARRLEQFLSGSEVGECRVAFRFLVSPEFIQGGSLDLIEVKDRVATHEQEAVGCLFPGVFVHSLLLDRGEVNHPCAPLTRGNISRTTHNRPSPAVPLIDGSPPPGRESVPHRMEFQEQRVDASVTFRRCVPHRHQLVVLGQNLGSWVPTSVAFHRLRSALRLLAEKVLLVAQFDEPATARSSFRIPGVRLSHRLPFCKIRCIKGASASKKPTKHGVFRQLDVLMGEIDR